MLFPVSELYWCNFDPLHKLRRCPSSYNPLGLGVAVGGRLTLGCLRWFLFQLLLLGLLLLPATAAGLAQLPVQHLLRGCRSVCLKTGTINNQTLMSSQFITLQFEINITSPSKKSFISAVPFWQSLSVLDKTLVWEGGKKN